MELMNVSFILGLIVTGLATLLVISVIGVALATFILIKQNTLTVFLNERFYTLQNQLQNIQTQIEVDHITSGNLPDPEYPEGTRVAGFITPDGKITAGSLPELIQKIIAAGPKSGYTEEQIARLKEQFEKLLDSDLPPEDDDSPDEPPFKS